MIESLVDSSLRGVNKRGHKIEKKNNGWKNCIALAAKKPKKIKKQWETLEFFINREREIIRQKTEN